MVITSPTLYSEPWYNYFACVKVAATLPHKARCSPCLLPFPLTQLCYQVTGATFASVIHELHFAWSWITLLLDPTVWLDGAKPANTCNPPSFPWLVPAHHTVNPPHKGAFPPQWCWLPGYAVWCADAIQGKEGRIQVLAGLAPSSQTVGSNKRVIHEQAKRSPWKTEANLAPARWWRQPCMWPHRLVRGSHVARCKE
jgi:hypothetical protein